MSNFSLSLLEFIIYTDNLFIWLWQQVCWFHWLTNNWVKVSNFIKVITFPKSYLTRPPFWLHFQSKTLKNISISHTHSSSNVSDLIPVTSDEQNWCRFSESEYSLSAFSIAFFVSGYAIPLGLIVIMYICMLRRLWHPVGHQISRVSREEILLVT